MWKVLGEETVIPKIGDVWKERMIQLSHRRKDRERFIGTLKDAEVRYTFDAIREIHNFIITLPPKYGHEDLEFMRAFVSRVNKSIKFPVIEFEGFEQMFSIIFTSEVEEDDYAQRRSYRSDYLDWVERQAKEKKAEEERQSF